MLSLTAQLNSFSGLSLLLLLVELPQAGKNLVAAHLLFPDKTFTPYTITTKSPFNRPCLNVIYGWELPATLTSVILYCLGICGREAALGDASAQAEH